MIVKLYKYLIYGRKDEMDPFFDLAQRAGFIEFIGVSHKKILELPEEGKTLLSAIKIAKTHTIHPKEAPEGPLEPVKVAETLFELNSEHEKLLEEKRMLAAEIARVGAFGDFSREELTELEREGRRAFQFFCMKSNLAKEAALPSELIYVGTEYDLDYFVAINKEPKHYPKMIEMQIERSASELKHRLLWVNETLGKIEADLRAYSNALPLLQKGLVELLNEHHLKLAKNSAMLAFQKTFFAIEAWVPKTRIKALYAILSQFSIECEEIQIESKDQIPTYIENRGAAKVGEDLVEIYDTPAHTDKDPSLWVLIFFALFFSMIISDAGYGLIYLLIGALLYWKLPRLAGKQRRFLKLIFILSSSCIIWGVLTGSYFGLEIGPNNFLRKSSFVHYLARKKAEYHLEKKDDVYEEYVKDFPTVKDSKDGHDFLVKAAKVVNNSTQFIALNSFYDNLLMEFSFLVGMIHIGLSLGRSLLRNWAGFGWIFFIIGGYLFFPTMLDATTILNFMGWVSKPIASRVGIQLIYWGIGGAVVLSIFQNKWRGFNEIFNVIQVFADILSYVRLYALALGGMVMAHTFNDRLGLDMGIFASIVVILVGHLTNITLCIMGGTIHGLRLNFLEWYHYCFEGGGRLFNPLKLRKTK